ncbi:MAG: ATP-binding protein [Prevotella sp.]|nr:ATP-binding protein [Prevotella sp.]
MEKLSIGKRLFLSIVLIFVLFAAAFVLFQYQREREYKRKLIDTQLQEYNIHFAESLQQYDGSDTLDYCRRFVIRHPAPDLVVTVMRSDSSVIFSTSAWSGNGNYFFSTKAFPEQQLIIRSARPYDVRLAEVLATDKTYLYFALLMMVILCIVLYRFTAPLGRNITNLRRFAGKIGKNEPIHSEDLTEFSDDELGEVAERIVTIYRRLERTKEEQNRLKRELTHNIAHELKTPAASIMGYLETIIDNKQIDAATRRQFIERSYAQAERLSALIQDISTLNRMDEFDPARQTFGTVVVDPAVSRIISDSTLQLSAKQMTVEKSIPAEAVVAADPSLVNSIFRNLLDNAIAYAGEGTTVTITAVDKGRNWLFRFADNGTGVDERHLPRLFERFYRVDEGRSRAVGGTGLGLAIVKNAVIICGGEISVKGKKGEGLTFEFTLQKASNNE